MTSRIGLTVPGMRTEVLTIDATVERLLPSHCSTPDGLKPVADLTESQARQSYHIYIPLVFSRMQVLVDHREEPTDAFVVATGRLTNGGFTSEGSRLLTPGLRYLLVFIPGLNALAKGYTQQWLIVYEAYRIDDQAMVFLKEQTVEQGVVSQQEEKVPLSKLIRYLSSDPQEPWP
ncbi:MAG TPA: hypothetical protein VH540_18300 [Ktedonobacterales bacterium]|jgi:hypothetical protein